MFPVKHLFFNQHNRSPHSCPRRNPQRNPQRLDCRAALVSLVLALGLGGGSPGWAADHLMLHLGPISQSIRLSDLEVFAETGVVPESLQRYRFLLSPQLQAALGSRLILDPAVTTHIFDEVVASPNGQQLIDALNTIAPGVTPEDVRVALVQAAAEPRGLSILGILQALPQETLEIDVSALLSLASQINLSRLENDSLGGILKNELWVPTDSAVSVPSFLQPDQPGPAVVERWELNLRDRDRQRTIPVDLYWSRQTQGPLVVMSHGFGADRRFLAYLAQHLASHGLTVAAVEHPGSNVAALIASPKSANARQASRRILPAQEFLERPRDIRFVLDRLAHLNETSYSLRGRLNTQNVTFIGHSLGGYTGLALAGAPLDTRDLQAFCEGLQPAGLSPADWLQCAALDLPVQVTDLSDRRITQLIAMNPFTGKLFSPEGLSQVKIPTLIVASSRDSITPIATQQLRPFQQIAGPKYLVAMIGGTHLSVGDPQNLNPEMGRLPFMPELPNTATSQLRDFLQGLSLSFVMQQTEVASQYAVFLTPEYTQRYSTPTLTLRMSQQLPKSVHSWLQQVDPTGYQRDQALDYVPSLLHLEAIDVQHRFRTLQQQMVAYLRTSPPSLTAIYLPRRLFQPSLQATTQPPAQE